MDPYNILTETLFRKGFGADQRTVDQYRRGIESIPEGLVQDDADLFLLSLADPRPGLLRACRLLGIQFEEPGYDENSAMPLVWNFPPLPTAPFWFRHDDGRKNHGQCPYRCRERIGDIQAGTAMEGIFAFGHHPDIVKQGENILNLPGTVRRPSYMNCAYLGVWYGRAILFLHWNLEHTPRFSYAFDLNPLYGALRLRRK